MARKHWTDGTRKTELIGLDEEGYMSAWSVGQVLPVTTFNRNAGDWIEEGHYVIEWKGHAITVHCSNNTDRTVKVLFMCSGSFGTSMLRTDVESMLLGKVISDPAVEADNLRKLQEIIKMLSVQQAAPHLRRGRLPQPNGAA